MMRSSAGFCLWSHSTLRPDIFGGFAEWIVKAKEVVQSPRIERFLLERTPDGRYQAVVLSADTPPYLLSSRPGVARTWAYLGPCIRHLETFYPEVTEYEVRLRPLA